MSKPLDNRVTYTTVKASFFAKPQATDLAEGVIIALKFNGRKN